MTQPEKTFLQRVAEKQAEKKAAAKPPASPKPIVAATAPTLADATRITAVAEGAMRSEESLVANAIEGTRNATLNTAAFNLARFVNEGILGADYVRDRLAAAARTAGLSDDEIDTTLRGDRHQRDSAAKRVGPAVPPPKPRTPVTVTSRGIPAEATVDGEPVDAEIVDTPHQLVDGATFILTIPDEIPALWGQGNDVLWAKGESMMIAGPMGLGKTTLAGQLIRAQLGIDKECLGLPVEPIDGKILYLAMDRPAQIARAMARQFGREHAELLAEHLVIWKGPPPADIAKNPGLLTAIAEQAGAEVVYVDSLKDAAIGLSEDEVGAGYNRARQQLLANDVQLAELHHTVKRGAAGGAPTHVADVYGSAWLTNGTGSIIMLGGEPGDPIVSFKHPRQPANEVGPFQLLHDQDAGTITVHHTTDLSELALHCGAEGLTAKAAAVNLFDTDRPTRGQIEKARRRLERLAEAGQLVCCEGGRGRGGDSVTTWFPAVKTA